MKQTDFQFEVRVVAGNPQATLNGLEARLDTLKGINSVAVTGKGNIFELTLNASFEDKEQAKRLHCKVMNTIMTSEGVTISQVTTTLTDIF